MKPDISNIDEVVKRYLPSAPEERIDSGTTRVLHELRTKPRRVSERTAETGVAVRRFTWPRQPAPVPSRQTPWKVAVICAAIAAALVVALSPTIWKTDDVKAVNAVRAVKPAPQSANTEAHPEGDLPRTIGYSTTKTLADGSRIEMRAGAEAVVENAPDGLLIRLHSGSIMVFAAKQAAGRHLYVQTRDLKVSVVGTVFLVKADDKGSRVAVMEGEVRVQQGAMEKSLRPGEQLASNPKSDNLQFLRETGWSGEAYAYLSKLHELMAQSLAARQSAGRTPSVSDKPKFEEASIRPCEQDIPGVAGTGRGDSPGIGGSGIRLSPGRVDALCLSVTTLIAMVAHRPLDNNLGGPGTRRNDLRMNQTYQFPFPEDGTRVRGGPDWVRSEKYTIAAIGDSTDAPTLQGPMLLDLLERRFNLKLRVETEEIPAYALTIAKGGLKIKPIESVNYDELRKLRASLDLSRYSAGPRPRGTGPADPEESDKMATAYAGLLGCAFLPPAPRNQEEVTRFREAELRGVQPPECGFIGFPHGPNMVLVFGGSPIRPLANSLMVDGLPSGLLSDTLNGLLVVDKTGLPDTNCLISIPPAGTPCAPLFNTVLEYAMDESVLTRMEKSGVLTPAELNLPKAPNIFKALEKLGLQLEKGKASREFIVIERIERPSEN